MSIVDVVVIEVGPVPARLAPRIAAFLDGVPGLRCRLGAAPLDVDTAWNSGRGQADARILLPNLAAMAGPGERALGITDVDLYSPVFTFVFGEATLGGSSAVFSLHRLRNQVYGLPPDPERLEERARREALHETGHLLGLKHCRSPGCAMRFCGAVEEIDLETAAFCDACAALWPTLQAAAGADPPGDTDGGAPLRTPPLRVR